MITLRMVAIAVAILVGIPITGVVADHLGSFPGGDPWQEAEAAVNATVRDIELVEPPARFDRIIDAGMPEQVVEGHTVFATIEIPVAINRSEWNVSVVGSISCDLDTRAEGEFFGGVPFPTRIEEGFVRCQVGEQVFLSPDPFMEPGHFSGSVTPFTPTSSWQAEAPNGELIDVHEYSFGVTRMLDDGTLQTERQYAWSVPLTTPWIHTNGKLKDWYCPIPEERLAEMGKTDFWAYHESDLPTYFWSAS